MVSHLDLDDRAFLAAFEAGTLDPTLFSHEAHLRLAWLHIQQLGIELAVPTICSQLINYVDGLGARDKYNATLTVAAAKTVYHFMLKSTATTL